MGIGCTPPSPPAAAAAAAAAVVVQQVGDGVHGRGVTAPERHGRVKERRPRRGHFRPLVGAVAAAAVVVLLLLVLLAAAAAATATASAAFYHFFPAAAIFPCLVFFFKGGRGARRVVDVSTRARTVTVPGKWQKQNEQNDACMHGQTWNTSRMWSL